jgi:chaperonin cofactor prefoldin
MQLNLSNFVNQTSLNSLNASNITTGTLTVARGGTGATTLIAGQLLIGNTTSALLQSANLLWDSTNNRLGIGITSLANILSKLTINDIVGDRNGFDHSESPLTITHQTGTSTTALNDPKTILHLCRQGSSGQAFGSKASFKLCRWETNGVNSRSRLDITLSHDQYNDINIISFRSDSRVGIGKTDPGYSLDVTGDINISGNFRINGTIFTGGATSQWITSSTNIYYNTGNVGIGTTTVNERLTIFGTVGRQMMITNTQAAAASYMGFANSANDSLAYIGVDGSGLTNIVYGALTLGTWKDKPILFTTGATNTEKMRIENNGNVGIGITNPTSKLHIIHSSTATNADATGGAGLYVFNPTNTANHNSIICNRIGGTTANKVIYSMDVSSGYGWSMYIQGNDTTNKLLRFHSSWDATSGTDRMVINGANGNVGIGTTDPTASVDILKATVVATTADLLNMRFDVNWGLKLQQNYTATGNIQYTFIHRYNAVNYNSLTFKAGNVGIGNTSPIAPLTIGDNSIVGSDGYIAFGKNSGGGSARNMRIGINANYDFVIGDMPTASTWTESFKVSYVAPVNSLVINSAGNVGINTASPGYKLDVSGSCRISGELIVANDKLVITGTAPTLYLRDTDNRTGMIHMNGNLMYFLNGNGNNSDTWAVQPPYNQWALTINMGDNTSTFGGSINAYGNVTAYFSDNRLKTYISDIKDPLKIITKLKGFYYTPNDVAKSYGFKNVKQEIGLSAQDVQKVLPELISLAPFDKDTDKDGNITSKSGENFLTMSYDRLAPVFVEAIKELNKEIETLKNENNELKEKYHNLLQDMILIKKTLNLI